MCLGRLQLFERSIFVENHCVRELFRKFLLKTSCLASPQPMGFQKVYKKAVLPKAKEMVRFLETLRYSGINNGSATIDTKPETDRILTVN